MSLQTAELVVNIFAWIGIIGGSALMGAGLLWLFIRKAMPRMWF